MIAVKKLLLENSDKRRDIYALKRPLEATQRVMVFAVKGREKLANHYHTTFDEHFMLISGSATLISHSVDTNGNFIGERSTQEIVAPCAFTMPAYTAYLFKFHWPALLVSQIKHREYDMKDVHVKLIEPD